MKFDLNPKIYISAVLAMLAVVVIITLAHAAPRPTLEASASTTSFLMVNVGTGRLLINVNKLADAIYKAENSIKFPYGIVSINTHGNKEYARKICINTINHALRDWNGRGDFIAFLGSRFAPIGVANDPNNLNANWIKNVRYFFKQ